MTVIFDTGSAWTWLPNENCPDDQCANNHYRFDKSTTYVDQGQEDEVFYGKGYVKGNIANDDIAVTSDKASTAK
jgi:hypothetical protein